MKLKEVLYHLLFWLLLMASFAISEWGYRESFADAVIFELLFLPARLIAVYVNWFYLIPYFLYKNRLAVYFGLLSLVLVVTSIGHRYFVIYWGYPTFFPEWLGTDPIVVLRLSRLVQIALVIISPVAYTTGFKLFMKWYKERSETEILRREKTEAELKFLKSQTNPHFLFNSLNSIYGLALEKSNKTPSLILKLSEILSYTLYESNSQKVALRKEIALIENILSLQKERYGKRAAIRFELEGALDEIEIAPLILIPFVENAFKHGLKNELSGGHINILIRGNEDVLIFKIDNSIAAAAIPQTEGGLGLKNVKRRLELIYGSRQSLDIQEADNIFTILLTIKYR